MRKIPDEEVLIYDIETTSRMIEDAKIRFFAYYSYKNKVMEIIEVLGPESLDEIKYIIDEHKVLVGFNNKRFDNEILKKFGIDLKYRTIVDLWEILAPKGDKTRNNQGGKGRHLLMQVEVDGDKKIFQPPNYKLETIVKALGLGKKVDNPIVYKWLQQETITPEQRYEILRYTKEDIIITRNLFEYLYNYFYSFRDFMNEKDVQTFKWLTTSVGSYTYKVLCHQAGLKEEYSEQSVDDEFEGGFVSEPTMEKAVGVIKSLDIASAYPHSFMMANLYSHSCTCCTEQEKYRGKGIFMLKGAYCTKKMGMLESVLKRFYTLRKEYKKAKDAREWTVKIIINTAYGVSGSPIFKSLYSINTASDCTYIVRTMINYVRQKFQDAGYTVLYNDTDSNYFLDPYNDVEKILKLKTEIIDYIKSCFPFPQETFDMGLEKPIKAMFFFKSGTDLKKKNYVYVTEDNRLIIKGLPIIKSNASALSLKIFKQQLRERIITKLDCKFNKEYLKQIIYEELKKDISLCSQLYKVKDISSYKEKTSLPAKIALYVESQFQAGAYPEKPDALLLIPNTKIDLGKKLSYDDTKKHKKGYCTIEDFKKFKLSVYDIDIEKTMSELEPFIKEEQRTLLEA